MAGFGRIGMLLALMLAAPPGPVRAQEADAAVLRQEAPVVSLAPVARSIIEARVPVTGSLVARDPVQVHANVAGYEIRELRAEVGDRVKAGDVLARLDDAALSAQLAQADAEHARATAAERQAESQIASAEAALTEAAAILQRTRSLRESGSASQAVLDQAIATEASAAAALASAREGLGVARAAVAQARAAQRIAALNLGHARITAPVDGIVVARNAEIGALSGSAGEPMFQLVARGEIELAADVIETALGQVKPGDPAEIRVSGLGDVAGRVRLVPARVDPATRLGQARIALDPAPGLRLGLFASGWIVTDRREALTVPLSAVLADERGERVQVVRNGVVETRPVRAGLVWQDRREILEGLEAGEQVIARAGAFFRTGDPVRAAPGSQP